MFLMCLFSILMNFFVKVRNDNKFKSLGLSIVAKAEKLLNEENNEKAFSLFRTAISRAVLSGDRISEKKIKNRMAYYGKENYMQKRDSVWKFIEYYAVTSDDFEKKSFCIEDWFLRNNLGKYTFEYNLLALNDTFSYWETRFDKYSYLIRKLSFRFMMENQKQVLKNELAVFGSNYNVEKMPVKIVAPKGIRECKFIIDGLKEEDKAFFLGSNSYCKLNNENEKKVFLIKKQVKDFRINQVIIERKSLNKIRIFFSRDYTTI